jgi:serine/threonine protein kinase
MFRCIEPPSVKDMYAIAKEFDYTFEFVCELFCQSHLSGTSTALPLHDTATVNQKLVGKISQSFTVGSTVDSAYGTGIEEELTITEHRSKRSRLEEHSGLYRRETLGSNTSNKSHKCPTCNAAFAKRSCMTRHQKIHRPGEFQCQYPECGRPFNRKDKLNDHYRSVHANDTSMRSTPFKRRDDPGDDSDSGDPPHSDGPFGKAKNPLGNKTQQSSQNSTYFIKPGWSTHRGCSNAANTYKTGLGGDAPVSEDHAATEYLKEFVVGKIIRKLGHGGFGSVYEVSNNHGIGAKNRGTFASKTIRLPKRRRGEILERAQNEINILQLLDHPHMIKLVGACILADRVFINTVPVADCNLKQFLNEEILPIPGWLKGQIWEQARGLASALAYFHAYDRGVACHGDLKPENILVVHDGSAKFFIKFLLADFGSATISASNLANSYGGRGVTPKYCAPECFTAEGARGPPSDIWSFGCVLAEIVSYVHDKTMRDFENFQARRMELNRDWNYYESLPVLHNWLRSLSFSSSHLTHSIVQEDRMNMIMEMLRPSPRERPSAAEVVARFDATDSAVAQKVSQIHTNERGLILEWLQKMPADTRAGFDCSVNGGSWVPQSENLEEWLKKSTG